MMVCVFSPRVPSERESLSNINLFMIALDRSSSSDCMLVSAQKILQIHLGTPESQHSHILMVDASLQSLFLFYRHLTASVHQTLDVSGGVEVCNSTGFVGTLEAAQV